MRIQAYLHGIHFDRSEHTVGGHAPKKFPHVGRGGKVSNFLVDSRRLGVDFEVIGAQRTKICGTHGCSNRREHHLRPPRTGDTPAVPLSLVAQDYEAYKRVRGEQQNKNTRGGD